MRSPKSRSRSKNNRPRPVAANIVNRVFDSSGPEGKVRGTPQQIIDKYQSLARDAQLGNDRVAAENFLQHAEHYTRMLGEAQREMDDRRIQQEREQQVRQQRDQQEREAREAREARRAEQDEAREARRVEPAEPNAQSREARRPEPEPFRAEPVEASDDAGPEARDEGPIETPEERKRTRRSRTRRPAEAQGDARNEPEVARASSSEAAE